MEIQLQELIEQIKKDGVETAEKKAEAIIAAANEQAEKIVSDAKAQAEKARLAAKEENERLVRVSEEAIRQAGRNLLLSFRESVNKELNAVAGEQVGAVCSSDALQDIIIKAVEAWAGNSGAEDICVLLNEKDLAKLEETLLAALKERMLGGVTLRASDDFDGGFRVAVDNGRAYYDYSVASVVEMLSAYLNPKVTALLKEAE